MRSGVTEVAFSTLPTHPDEATQAAIAKGSVDSLRDVETIGNATGSTIGWVVDAMLHFLGSDVVNSFSLYGVFGYAGIDVHTKWRRLLKARRPGRRLRKLCGRRLEFRELNRVEDIFMYIFEKGCEIKD